MTPRTAGRGDAPRAEAREEVSAGGIVFRWVPAADGGARPVYLLIRDSYRNWGFPKGHLEAGEVPEGAAVREVGEETGLAIERLYNVTVQPFYLHVFGTVQLAVVFCAFVAEPATVTLGPEHQDSAWLPVDEAMARFAWPREREAMSHVLQLLGGGDAGAVEDVLRVI